MAVGNICTHTLKQACSLSSWSQRGFLTSTHVPTDKLWLQLVAELPVNKNSWRSILPFLASLLRKIVLAFTALEIGPLWCHRGLLAVATVARLAVFTKLDWTWTQKTGCSTYLKYARPISAAEDSGTIRLLFLIPVVGFDLKTDDAAQSGHLWPDLSPFVPLSLCVLICSHWKNLAHCCHLETGGGLRLMSRGVKKSQTSATVVVFYLN